MPGMITNQDDQYALDIVKTICTEVVLFYQGLQERDRALTIQKELGYNSKTRRLACFRLYSPRIQWFFSAVDAAFASKRDRLTVHKVIQQHPNWLPLLHSFPFSKMCDQRIKVVLPAIRAENWYGSPPVFLILMHHRIRPFLVSCPHLQHRNEFRCCVMRHS
jgi:hypothetical protein